MSRKTKVGRAAAGNSHSRSLAILDKLAPWLDADDVAMLGACPEMLETNTGLATIRHGDRARGEQGPWGLLDSILVVNGLERNKHMFSEVQHKVMNRLWYHVLETLPQDPSVSVEEWKLGKI